MKKLFMLVAVLLVPVLAEAGVNTLTPGHYEGTIVDSINPSMKGLKLNADVKTEGSNVVATVTYEGGKEVWTWTDTTLTQEEIDLATNKPVRQYGAVAATTPTGSQQRYAIRCTDKAKNVCDAGIDSRNAWEIETGANSLKYTVYGVASAVEKANPAATAIKRHEFVFSKK